jgi:sugar phosphate isomerase/epimerase
MSNHINNFPKLHNAMWPGLVGKGSPGAEPCLDLTTMLDLTAGAQVDGIKFDGVDIFLFEPHINIDISDEDLRRITDKIAAYGFVVGSVVAPIWPPTGGGSAMGSTEERKNFVAQVRKGCRIAAKLREFGVRPYGIVRLDTACSVDDWAKDPDGNTKLIAQTLREACHVAESFGERLAAEGEICWGGLHSWKQALKLLELVGRPKTLGFQADMAHTLLLTLGYNAPEDAILPENWDWSDPAKLDEALKTLTAALRPWTIDFHVAQNDATVKGSGTHDKTGHHCLPNDPNGKLVIPRHAGYWLRDDQGQLTKAIRHICWDGCMFPNQVMTQPQTWNDILAAMIAVRDAHGWTEPAVSQAAPNAPVEKPAEAAEVKPVAPAPPKKRGRPPKKPAPVEAPKPEPAVVSALALPKPVEEKAVPTPIAPAMAPEGEPAPAPVKEVVLPPTPPPQPAEKPAAVVEVKPVAPAPPKKRGRPPKKPAPVKAPKPEPVAVSALAPPKVPKAEPAPAPTKAAAAPVKPAAPKKPVKFPVKKPVRPPAKPVVKKPAKKAPAKQPAKKAIPTKAAKKAKKTAKPAKPLKKKAAIKSPRK